MITNKTVSEFYSWGGGKVFLGLWLINQDMQKKINGWRLVFLLYFDSFFYHVL